nr:helix-turn-helix domain-containing protein [Dactylosporangium thailandense]
MLGTIVEPQHHPKFALAERLKELRLKGIGGLAPITQAELSKALGVTSSLVSSWESSTAPALPPVVRIRDYAVLFCTENSVEGKRLRLLDARLLDEDGRQRCAELEQELLGLRQAADSTRVGAVFPLPAAALDEDVRRLRRGPLHFADGGPITIVCARLPASMRERMPFTRPGEPDFSESYTLADLGALIELHGHIRALNPLSVVKVRAEDVLESDDIVAHVVLLGGVDWNLLTRTLLVRLDVPVTQMPRESDEVDAAFQVRHSGGPQRYAPKIIQGPNGAELIEDVAHFFRAPNPYNRKHTVTIFNGMYGRGTEGAVRSLTDERFRERNGDYVIERLQRHDTLSLLTSVQIVRGKVVTPDWTDSAVRLHESPEPGEEGF